MVDAGFDDGGLLLLLVVIEDGHFIALDDELHFFTECDVGGFGPGEVEFLADDVGLVVSLDGEELVGVGVVGGVGGGVFRVTAIFGLRVGVVGGGASGWDFLLLGVDEFTGLPCVGEGECCGEKVAGSE
jgi:hypothetical protein